MVPTWEFRFRSYVTRWLLAQLDQEIEEATARAKAAADDFIDKLRIAADRITEALIMVGIDQDEITSVAMVYIGMSSMLIQGQYTEHQLDAGVDLARKLAIYCQQVYEEKGKKKL